MSRKYPHSQKAPTHEYSRTHRNCHIYVSQADKALDYTKTTAFALDMKLRPHVERIIAGVTRYNGAPRAPSQAKGDGIANADYQAKMAREPSGRAYNLKCWHKIIQEREKAQRYTPPAAVV